MVRDDRGGDDREPSCCRRSRRGGLRLHTHEQGTRCRRSLVGELLDLVGGGGCFGSRGGVPLATSHRRCRNCGCLCRDDLPAVDDPWCGGARAAGWAVCRTRTSAAGPINSELRVTMLGLDEGALTALPRLAHSRTDGRPRKCRSRTVLAWPARRAADRGRDCNRLIYERWTSPHLRRPGLSQEW